MRGGGTAVSGREGKARLLVACTLLLQGYGRRSVCRAATLDAGADALAVALVEEGEDHCVELAAGPAGTCP